MRHLGLVAVLLVAVSAQSVVTDWPRVSAFVLFAVASSTQSPADRAPTGRAQEVFDRAISDFQNGRIPESVAGFDTLVTLVPTLAPQLWQRGIALYSAGRYADCRAQFESHRTVNPNDVENAAWHFLCVARADSPEKARTALLPVGPDARVPMREIYEMFKGTLKPEDVVAAAGSRTEAQFYAQLYVGLYFEALGNERLALEHITAAAAERFALVGGYMYSVARVHLRILTARGAPPSLRFGEARRSVCTGAPAHIPLPRRPLRRLFSSTEAAIAGQTWPSRARGRQPVRQNGHGARIGFLNDTGKRGTTRSSWRQVGCGDLDLARHAGQDRPLLLV